MKEDMLEVLIYLFKNHMKTDCKLPLAEDVLMSELERVGFNTEAIYKALNWLEGLLELQDSEPPSSANKSFRHYSPAENFKLNVKIRGFLLFLEQIGVLSSITRELVIDRLMAIEDDELTLSQVQWVTLLVLVHQPNEDAALACMESLVLENTEHGSH